MYRHEGGERVHGVLFTSALARSRAGMLCLEATVVEPDGIYFRYAANIGIAPNDRTDYRPLYIW
jgi:hypothetical protein